MAITIFILFISTAINKAPAMLGYTDLALKLIIALNLSYFTYEYIRCKHIVTKLKCLKYYKMNNFKTIMSTTGPTPMPVTSTTETTNYKDRLCGIVSSGDAKKYLGKEYTIKDIEALSPADQEKLFQCYQVKFGMEVVTPIAQLILRL